MPPVDPAGLILAGEPGCDGDPEAVAACITPAHAIQLERLIETLLTFRRLSIAACLEGPNL